MPVSLGTQFLEVSGVELESKILYYRTDTEPWLSLLEEELVAFDKPSVQGSVAELARMHCRKIEPGHYLFSPAD